MDEFKIFRRSKDENKYNFKKFIISNLKYQVIQILLKATIKIINITIIENLVISTKRNL